MYLYIVSLYTLRGKKIQKYNNISHTHRNVLLFDNIYFPNGY